MSDSILAYTLDGSSIVLDRENVVLTSRSKIVERQKCELKAFRQYHGGPTGTGLQLARPSDDLVLGLAIHAGMETMLRPYIVGETPERGVAASAAWRYMFDAAITGLSVQDDENMQHAAPEVAALLIEEQAALAYMLISAFERRRLDAVLSEFQVMEVEDETNWVLAEPGETPAGKWIVVMSRPDAILKRKETGALLPASFKSLKRWNKEVIRELACDPQRWSEGLAVQAGIGGGVEPEGTFYFHFIKDDRRMDKDMLVRRYVSPLIRPWARIEAMGDFRPSDFAMSWEYPSSKTLGMSKLSHTKWKRVNIWRQLPGGLPKWLEWLDSGMIDQERHPGRDWLAEAVASPELQRWDEDLAGGWVQGQIAKEAIWQYQLQLVEREAAKEGISSEEAEPLAFERRESSCKKWNKFCAYYANCWEHQSLADDVAKGRFIARQPHHEQEYAQVYEEPESEW